MEQSVLDKISRAANTNYFYDGWANGTIGSISDHTGKCIYRFHQAERDINGHLHVLSNNDEDAPVVAVGIVAYWLHFRQNNNRLASLFGPDIKSIPQIFQDYTADRLRAYKKHHEQTPSCWRSDFERDFYTHHIIPSERRLIKQSEALFEYITPDDRQLVRDVMREYILYLQQIRDTYQPPIPKPKHEKKIEIVRTVNIDNILIHLKRSFDKQTYSSTLKSLLEQNQSDKELARAALLIYDSHYFLSNDYSAFAKWYKDFCRFVGCEFHSSYEPGKLKPIHEDLKNKYYFLL